MTFNKKQYNECIEQAIASLKTLVNEIEIDAERPVREAFYAEMADLGVTDMKVDVDWYRCQEAARLAMAS